MAAHNPLAAARAAQPGFYGKYDSLQASLKASEAREAELTSRLAQRELELAGVQDELARAQALLAMHADASAHSPSPADPLQYTPATRVDDPDSGSPTTSDENSPSPADAKARQYEQVARHYQQQVLALRQREMHIANRCSCARELLVDIACGQRDVMCASAAFRAWTELLWLRRMRQQAQATSEELLIMQNARHPAPQPPPFSLNILTSLEEQRQRTLRLLHEAHLENRWHRQWLGGSLRRKQVLLLWWGQTLRRCWLAWAAHLVRVRIEREVTDELRQLNYALRVATMSRHAALDHAVGKVEVKGAERVEEGRPEGRLALPSTRRHPLAPHVMRRVWLSWTYLVVRTRMTDEHWEAVVRCVSEGIRVVRSAAEREAAFGSGVDTGRESAAAAVSARVGQAAGPLLLTDHPPSGQPPSMPPPSMPPLTPEQVSESLVRHALLPTPDPTPSPNSPRQRQAAPDDVAARLLSPAAASADGHAEGGAEAAAGEGGRENENAFGPFTTLLSWLKQPPWGGESEHQPANQLPAWYSDSSHESSSANANSSTEAAQSNLGSLYTAVDAAVDAIDSQLQPLLRAQTLAVCLSAWRIFLAAAHFARAEEVDRSALVISLWKAASSGLLGTGGSTHTHGIAIRGDGGRLASAAMLLGVDVSSSDESDESDNEGERDGGRGADMPYFAAAAAAQQASWSYAEEEASDGSSTPERDGPPSPLAKRMQSPGLWRNSSS